MFLVEYGSRAHGTNVEASDHDLLGIYLETDAQLYGLDIAETQKFRVRADENNSPVFEPMLHSPNQSRSNADDTDMHFHSLKKFVSLAAAGNPTVMSVLWSPEPIITTAAAELLVVRRDQFLSKKAAYRHAGYARSQREAMLGINNKRTNRPELIQIHGFDSKYAAHMIRILLAGLDLVRDRTVHLPMKPEQIALLLSIKNGEVSLDEVLAMSHELEAKLEKEAEASDLRDKVDMTQINVTLREVRNAHLGR